MIGEGLTNATISDGFSEGEDAAEGQETGGHRAGSGGSPGAAPPSARKAGGLTPSPSEKILSGP